MQEVWRDIEGHGGFYQISNLGRVKSRGKQCAVSEKRDIIRATSLTVALSKKYGVSNRVIGLIVRGMSYQNVK